MSRFFNGLLLGLILGIAGYWFVEKKPGRTPRRRNVTKNLPRGRVKPAAKRLITYRTPSRPSLKRLNLNADNIKDELARTGKIVRRKAQDLGDEVRDAAVDARIVTAIKAKYLADSDLSAWKISVTSDQGHVALSGSVSAPDAVGKAVTLALETDGVRDVTYNLEVK